MAAPTSERVREVEVREAVAAEWPTLAALTVEVYAALAPVPAPPFWSAYLDTIEGILTQPDEAARLVALVGGRLAASVLLCPPSPGPRGGAGNPLPELRLLAVDPAFRNLGLAGRLIGACEDRVREDGYEAITLHTTSLMPTAKAMYERRGYERAPELDFRPTDDFVVWGYRRPVR